MYKQIRDNLLNAKQKNEICWGLTELNHFILKNELNVLLNGKKIATIYPLWVEAYYYNKSQNWCDQAIHGQIGNDGGVEEQKGHELTLYFHRKGSVIGGYEGVDLVLSDKDTYALSFLIKNCIFLDANGKKDNYSEKELDARIIQIVKDIDSNLFLRHKEKIKRTILEVKMVETGINDKLCFFETKRVGIECKNKDWEKYELASFIMRKEFYKEKYKTIFAKNAKKYYK